MNVYITKTYGLEGTAAEAQSLVVKEAKKIKLDNNIKEYNIKYRVRIQDIGWQEWKYNGQLAGTVNLGKRIEAIEIQITE